MTGRAGPASPEDAIDDLKPSLVASPADAEAVAATMLEAAREGLAVVVRGRGTKLEWGNTPEQLDLILDVSGLDAVIEHAAGDLIVRVQPGVALCHLQRALEPAGQRLAIDEVVDGSSIGGIIATGLSGPRRMLFGGVRDLLLGVTLVRADGTVTRTGGRVVKNVAGYDLAKLYAGSYGTLGVITEAIFRLHPLPEATAYLSAIYDSERGAAEALGAVVASQAVCAAVEIDRPVVNGPVAVAVLMEGVAAGLAARINTVLSALGPVTATVSETAPAWWADLPGPVTLKLAVPTSVVPDALVTVTRLATTGGLPVAVRGSAGIGVLYLGLAADTRPASCSALLAGLRAFVATTGGSAIVLRAPQSVRAGVDVWGPVPALELMRRVKANFDPDRRLAPGRFVGGI
jgi:glycolate oxidase FAD binding subunit